MTRRRRRRCRTNWLRLLPQAQLKIIPGCAHVPQLQSPEVFLDAIGDFLPGRMIAHRGAYVPGAPASGSPKVGHHLHGDYSSLEMNCLNSAVCGRANSSDVGPLSQIFPGA